MTGLLTCSALPYDFIAELPTVSHHTQRVFPSRDEILKTPLCQALVFPAFLLRAIGIVENQFIEVEVPRGWAPAEPKAICGVPIGSFEVIYGSRD